MPFVARVAIQFHEGDVSDQQLGQIEKDLEDAAIAKENATRTKNHQTLLTQDEENDKRANIKEYDAAKKAGWHPTGKYFDLDVRYLHKPDNEDTKDVNEEASSFIPRTSWGDVREVHFGVDREYGGINSSGGPQQSGRADHRLITLVRNSDWITPALYKRCCNGMQLRRLVIYDEDRQLWVVGDSCHVVSFEFVGDKKNTTRYEISEMGDANSRQYLGRSFTASQDVGDTRRYERLLILYTSAAMKVGSSPSSPWHGWNTGNEIAWNNPGYVVSPRQL